MVFADGREALVTARVETYDGQISALLEVAIAPTSQRTEDRTVSGVAP
jgi:hypothetical protein